MIIIFVSCVFFFLVTNFHCKYFARYFFKMLSPSRWLCVCGCVRVHSCAQLLSCVWVFVTLWTIVHGIFQARILEWVTTSSSRRSSLPRNPNCVSWVSLHWQADSLPLSHLGKPVCNWAFFSISGLPCGSAGKESACNVGDLGLIPGVGRSPGKGKGYPL